MFAKLSLENTVSSAAADGERECCHRTAPKSACQAAAQSMVEHDDKAFFVKCVADPPPTRSS